jgi:hypothetical protein
MKQPTKSSIGSGWKAGRNHKRLATIAWSLRCCVAADGKRVVTITASEQILGEEREREMEVVA